MDPMGKRHPPFFKGSIFRGVPTQSSCASSNRLCDGLEQCQICNQALAVAWSKRKRHRKVGQKWERWMTYSWWKKIQHQLIGSSSQNLQGFWHPRWCRISEPSTVFMSICFQDTLLATDCSHLKMGWLEGKPFVLGFGLFSGARLVLGRVRWCMS